MPKTLLNSHPFETCLEDPFEAPPPFLRSPWKAPLKHPPFETPLEGPLEHAPSPFETPLEDLGKGLGVPARALAMGSFGAERGCFGAEGVYFGLKPPYPVSA